MGVLRVDTAQSGLAKMSLRPSLSLCFQGCYDLVTSFMETNMGIIAGVAFGIAFSQVAYCNPAVGSILSPASWLSFPSLVSRSAACLPVPWERLIDGVRAPCSLVLRSSVY